MALEQPSVTIGDNKLTNSGTVDQHHHCLIFQLNLKSSSRPSYRARFEILSFLVLVSAALTGRPVDKYL